jgi:hypothetical protein
LAKIVAPCLGLVVVALVGVVITANIGHYTTATIPAWLPPIPLAVVAIMLFVLGTLAWFRDEKLDDASRGTSAGH